MKFFPREVLFSPSGFCNLSCLHCTVKNSWQILSKTSAVRFLRQCKEIGINRVGFSGGEPFLCLDFLSALVDEAVSRDMFFGRIMTNAVWYKDRRHLRTGLVRLYNCGYDGDICLSVDAFHNQNLKKVSTFITTAVEIWQRPDLISIVYVSGAKDAETESMLNTLSKMLMANLEDVSSQYKCIRNKSIFIKLSKIDLSAVGTAGGLKDPWADGKWFKEDYCRGPGNVLFVLPNGDVKPCCGYATDLEALTLGNIKRESADVIIKNAHSNRYVSFIFSKGLSRIRKNLQKLGVKFPGKTSNHCFFCYYIFSQLPSKFWVKQGCIKT